MFLIAGSAADRGVKRVEHRQWITTHGPVATATVDGAWRDLSEDVDHLDLHFVQDGRTVETEVVCPRSGDCGDWAGRQRPVWVNPTNPLEVVVEPEPGNPAWHFAGTILLAAGAFLLGCGWVGVTIWRWRRRRRVSEPDRSR